MGDTPKLSVVMPVYNDAEYLEQSLGSALGQTLVDIELICVDDGSTDGSLDILRAYEARDPRVRVIAQENAGPGAARNAALRVATGEYVAFLDSDDLLEPEALQTLYTYAKSCGLDELFYTASVFYEGGADSDFHPNYAYKNVYPGTFSGRDLFIELVQNWDLKDPVCLQILKRDFLEREGIAFREGIVHEDALFTMECLALAERVRIIDAPLYRRRIRAGSIMTSASMASEFNSAYGYFICMREALEFAKERGLDEDREYLGALTVRLNRFRSSAANKLAMLEEQDIQERLALLSDDDYAGFKLLVYDRMGSASAPDYDQLYRCLTARIDVKNAGAPGNDVEVLELSDPGARVEAPDWFRDGDGVGHVVRSSAGSLSMRLRCSGAGELQIKLKGQDVRDAEGARVPAWIDYTSLSVDGRELLGGTRAVWHDKPFKHRMPVADGQVVEISLSWHSHDEAGLATERAARDENRALREAEKKLERELAAAEDEVRALRSSNSWKIGRFITWLPRKIKALFK